MPDGARERSRRRFLKTAGIVGTAATAGCLRSLKNASVEIHPPVNGLEITGTNNTLMGVEVTFQLTEPLVSQADYLVHVRDGEQDDWDRLAAGEDSATLWVSTGTHTVLVIAGGHTENSEVVDGEILDETTLEVSVK